jgi:hypothetical protein
VERAAGSRFAVPVGVESGHQRRGIVGRGQEVEIREIHSTARVAKDRHRPLEQDNIPFPLGRNQVDTSELAPRGQYPLQLAVSGPVEHGPGLRRKSMVAECGELRAQRKCTALDG